MNIDWHYHIKYSALQPEKRNNNYYNYNNQTKYCCPPAKLTPSLASCLNYFTLSY